VSAAVELPTWAVYAVSLGSPVLAFFGVIAGHFLVRRGAQELEIRSKREETMRNLRWAAELAVSDEPRTAQLGVAELNALAESDLLDNSQLLFVDAALDAVIEEPEDAIEEATGDVDVELIGEPKDDAPGEPPAVPSEEEPGVEGDEGG
jgi:hypothetical protein